jgi:hypothetical protein
MRCGYRPSKLSLVFSLGLLLVACGLARSTSPSPEALTPLPTSSPLPRSRPSPMSSVPAAVRTTPSPGEIMAALEIYDYVRAEAERTLNPELLRQVSVDPYLSEKMERIRANARDGSRWETIESRIFLESLEWEDSDHVRVRVRKQETKLFFPPGSSLPDDETCNGPIYSYRNCTYQVEYQMVRREGRWYVAMVRVLSECPSICRRILSTPNGTPAPVVFPNEAVWPSGWPALSFDLYFLRAGRLWRWLAQGGLEALTPADGMVVQGYVLSPGGRYIAYVTASDALYALETSAGRRIFPVGDASPVVREYSFLSGSRLLYITQAGELYVADLDARAQIVPRAGDPPAVVKGYSRAENGRSMAYETTGGELYVVDLEERRPVRVPVRGMLGQFALNAEGNALLYMSKWSDGKVYSATLYVVDLRTPERPVELGSCGVREDRWGCMGFLLSPDGQKVVWQDGNGLWLSSLAPGNARLLLKIDYRPPDEGGPFCHACNIEGWMPGGRGVVVRMCCWEGAGFGIVDVETGALWIGDESKAIAWCYTGCGVEAVWASEGLWVSDVPNQLMFLRSSSDGRFEAVRALTLSRNSVWPMELQPLPGGRLAFADQRCDIPFGLRDDARLPPALYILEANGQLRRVAPLPRFRCTSDSIDPESPPDITYPGQVLWTADGSAFLYLDADGHALLVGRADGSVLWDVRTQLMGAKDFRSPFFASPVRLCKPIR